MKCVAILLIVCELLLLPTRGMAEVSPAAVGWGNLIVPGLGATLRGYPKQGLTEAGLELGTYFGGTYGVREGGFTIDGSVNIPTSPNLTSPLIGQALQEFGLKYHFHNTFYHYQQAALAVQDSDREKRNPQPLYRGNWKDMLTAPFSLKNLGSIWVFPLIAASGVYLVYNYKTTPIQRYGFRTSAGNEALYGFSQVTMIPVTGAIGEEPLFRGFMMRETRLYTNSAIAALMVESAMFTLTHPAELRLSGFLSGIYFGLMTNHFDGNIEPAIAAHFWVNVLDGVISYWTLRRAQGKDTPFAPPLTGQVTIPF